MYIYTSHICSQEPKKNPANNSTRNSNNESQKYTFTTNNIIEHLAWNIPPITQHKAKFNKHVRATQLNYFPQYLCWGYPFLHLLTQSRLSAGTELMSPPIPLRHLQGNCYRWCDVPLPSSLVAACFLKADRHYTTI